MNDRGELGRACVIISKLAGLGLHDEEHSPSFVSSL